MSEPKGKINFAFLAFPVIIITAVACLMAAYTYRPELVLTENKLLSEKFTKAYEGPDFNVLRSQCWPATLMSGAEAMRWTNTYQEGDWEVEIGYVQSKNPCLANERSKFVIKRKPDSGRVISIMPSYAVYTSGGEMQSPYTVSLIDKLLGAVKDAQQEIEKQKAKNATWAEHKKTVEASWGISK